jgi:hypothetical protein
LRKAGSRWPRSAAGNASSCQVVDPDRLLAAPRLYLRFARDLRTYRQLPGAEQVTFRESSPQLWDRTSVTPYDPHYFFQDVWAARRVAERRPTRHVDVGSRLDIIGFLTCLTEVVFVDIRPLEAELPNLTCVAGSVIDLPLRMSRRSRSRART